MLIDKDDALKLIETLKSQGYTTIPCDDPTKAIEGAVMTRLSVTGEETVEVQWHAFSEEYREEIHNVNPQTLADFARNHKTSSANDPKQLRLGRVYYDHDAKKAITYRTYVRELRGSSDRVREQLADLFDTQDPGIRSEELRNLLTDTYSSE